MFSFLKLLFSLDKRRKTQPILSRQDGRNRKQTAQPTIQSTFSNTDVGGATQMLSLKGQHAQPTSPQGNIVTQWMEQEQRQDEIPDYPGIENYEIMNKLGEGAFAHVYKARDRCTGQKVAIKTICKHEPSSEGVMEKQSHCRLATQPCPGMTERPDVLKEVQMMKHIRHKNIVQLLHYIESKDHDYLVLELCKGGELFHCITKFTYFSESLARHVISQVAEAVRYLHEECGIVHRDIKPENILFDPIPHVPFSSESEMDQALKPNAQSKEGVFIPGVGGGGIGVVKLADFGLSKIVWDKPTRTPCGTVGYTAPEVVNDRMYSKSVDVWALGCVLFTMLCGFPPFHHESVTVLTDNIAHGRYAFLSPWWDSVSDAAKDLVAHLLCVDPLKRYTIQDVLSHPWMTGQECSSSARSLKEVCEHYVSPTVAVQVGLSESTLHRKDTFSSSDSNLKEILDMTYTIQRMDENNVWRGAKCHGLHQPDYDTTPDDEHDRFMVQACLLKPNDASSPAKPPNATVSSHHTASRSSTQPMFDIPRALEPFDLNMNNATLLKNRRRCLPHNHPVGPSLHKSLAI